MSARLALILLTASLLGGCASLEYYWQSVRGHLEVQTALRPIDAVIADPESPEALRRRLREVQAMVRFAAAKLDLPGQGSYRDDADIGREYVVWTVVAAPRLSLEPRRWCYPVVGCLSYRGFYDLAEAGRYARSLRQADFDVYVAPVRAYSTLGWFSDPVLNTLMSGPDWDLAGVIFHELTHQKLYLAGDTDFNEAYATTVQREGQRRWLAARGSERQRRHFGEASARRREFLALVDDFRARLADLYRSAAPPATRLAAREGIFRAMRGAYADLKSRWQGYRGYDRWFGQDLNNAKLALAATYHALVPGFEALLKLKGGDLRAFHQAVARLEDLSPQERRRRLRAWQSEAGG